MRLLFLGDIVGRSGRKAVVDALPGLRRRYALDFVIINGENSAGGFGITEAILEELIGAGADAVTLGNHAFDQKDALVFIERFPQLIRPINYPKGTPGRGASLIKTQGGADVLHHPPSQYYSLVESTRWTWRTQPATGHQLEPAGARHPGPAGYRDGAVTRLQGR